MPSVERLSSRATRRAARTLTTIGDEFRDKRVAIGLSQQQVANAAGISRLSYLRVEHGKLQTLSITRANRIASVLGLDLSVRVFPGAEPLRDAASLARLERVLEYVTAPLTCSTEVPLRSSSDRPREQRAWDAMLFGHGRRTGIELEMRIRDAQALERRINLKRQDDPVDAFVLLVADSKHNRQLLEAHPSLFPGLSRITFRELTRQLRAGRHPPSCLVVV
jgi:transcriptional regulator with XRE-family HTH domain